MTKGIVGESMVKGILKNLPDDYYAMHDLILEKIKGRHKSLFIIR